MSSRMNRLRPWVAAIRSLSLGWITRSCTGTVGMLLPSRVHTRPPSSVAYTPCSVPANSRLGLRRSSRSTCTGQPSGKLPAMLLQVRP
jgi:hypothetical protein